MDGDFFFFLGFETSVGSIFTEFSAHSPSKHFSLSQALLMLGIGTNAGNLDGSFEMSVVDLVVQHTCRRIVPSVSVILQAGGFNVCSLTTA